MLARPKNGLSGLLAEVRRGQTVLIMHRGQPIAKITSYSPAELTDDSQAAQIEGFLVL